MGALFGKSKKPKSRVTEQDKAILQLMQQRDKLIQYQKKIVINMEKERLLAKQLLQENKKDKAKLLLRKKKYQEQILSKTDVQLENLDKMVHDLEFAQIETQLIEGLKIGNEALKKIHQILSIEDIENILDEAQDGIEKQREIDELLTGVLTQEDEDDVMEELNSIIEEDEINLPEPPTDKLETEKKIKEKTNRPQRVKLEAS